MRRLLAFAGCAVLALAPDARASATGALWIRAEATLPIGEESGLACPPMPRGRYFFTIDDGPRVEVRADQGTLVGGLETTKRHLVRLYRYDRQVASLRVDVARTSAKHPRCLGLANYYGDGFAFCG